jgi:threonine dehydratase
MTTSSDIALPTAADVEQAARRISGVALHTPLVSSPVLDALTGGRIFLKAETLQRTGSFKFRGAYNKLSSLPPEARSGGVVAFSSGNHAQGVAAAARLLDMPAVIVMPRDAPRPKRERTAELGAEVVLYDREREDREVIARELVAARGAVLVPPYDDPLIIAGQGTAGREIIDDLGRDGMVPDIVIVNASGGGLSAGVALAVKAGAPDARLYTAEPQDFDDHARSFRSGKRESNAAISGSICDALMAATPGRLTFEINRVLVGEGLTVSDAEVARAVGFAFRELKLVVEPGGAVSLAAILAGKLDLRGKVVAAVLSGGNVDPELFYKLVA